MTGKETPNRDPSPKETPNRDGLCTAQSRSRGRLCRRRAMIGKTLCYQHGGKTPSGPGTGRPPVHGLYSKYKRHLTDAIELVEGMRDAELEEEMALFRSLLIRLQDVIGPDDPKLLDGKVLAAFIALGEQIRKIADTMTKPKGPGAVYVVRLEETGFPRTVIRILHRIGGDELVARFSTELAAERPEGEG